ncbi:crossover junction endodeoxyribonuclease RuvC [bacterium]|nr:crossover junction endodeoxyribonuclease RuvC [bacterium]
MKQPDLILGIDPGSVKTGYAILTIEPSPRVYEYGIIKAPASWPVYKRLGKLKSQMDEILKSHNPSVVAVESVFVHQNVKSALVLSQARGTFLASCSERDMSFLEYPPTTIKKAVAGKGHASKESVRQMICLHLGLEETPTSLDASDALAIAWTGAIFGE